MAEEKKEEKRSNTSDDNLSYQELVEELEKLRKEMKWAYGGYGGLIFWGIVVTLLLLLYFVHAVP